MVLKMAVLLEIFVVEKMDVMLVFLSVALMEISMDNLVAVNLVQ